MKILTIITILLMNLFFLEFCSSVRYTNPPVYSGNYSRDYYNDNMGKIDSMEKTNKNTGLTGKEKRKWKRNIKRIKKYYGTDPFKYNMLLAHCYRQLQEYKKAAESYNNAAKSAKNSEKRRLIQKEVIKSYADAGYKSEIEKNYPQAIIFFEDCNRYCAKNGFKNTIPYYRIEHLKRLKK